MRYNVLTMAGNARALYHHQNIKLSSAEPTGLKYFLCWLVTLLLLVAVSLSAFAGWPWKGPYLLFTGDPTTMDVVWELRQPLACSIEWGRDPDCSDGRVEVSSPFGEPLYHVQLTNLAPGTPYHYRLDFGTDTMESTFRSAPDEDATHVRFLGWADTQYVSGSDPRSCYSDIAGATLSAIRADPSLQTFLLHAGDWVYSSREDFWDEYFRNYRARQVMSMLPLQGCIGNHDLPLGRLPDGLLKYWPYPYVSDHYYSFDYGPVHVVVLDQFSDEMWDGSPIESNAQLTWLREDLRAHRRPWTIALFHVPLHEEAEYGREYRERELADLLIPYLSAGHVDLLLCGHDHRHLYEADGTIPQLSMGSASDMQGDRCYYLFDVTPECITATAFHADGSAIETITVKK